jgi:hypothetical protein
LRYFFEYYTRWISDPALREEVKRLKAIGNRFTRLGNILHLVIRTHFKKAKEGRVLSVDWAEQWASRLVNDDIRYSENLRAGGRVSDQAFGPVALSEILSGRTEDVELLEQTREQLVRAIRNFYGSEEIRKFKAVGERAISLIEKRVRLNGPGYRASGQIDMAISVPQAVVIADWKLGSPAVAGNDSLQLAFYGLWASEEFGRPVEELRTFKVHLADNEVVRFTTTTEVLENARARLRQDIRRMEMLEGYGKRGEADVFTRCDQPRVCRQCSFVSLCCSDGGPHGN